MNRTEFFTAIADRLSPEELAYVQKAYWLVKEAHRRQSRRLTGERFFEHVRRVSYEVAITYGYCDADHITLGLIHDVVEDTFVPGGVISGMFGQQMYRWCLSLSKEIPSFHEITGEMIRRAKLPEAEYYANLAVADLQPRRVKAVDRKDNLTDFDQWEPARREKYDRETRTYVLPIARATDARIADEIERRLSVPKNFENCA